LWRQQNKLKQLERLAKLNYQLLKKLCEMRKMRVLLLYFMIFITSVQCDDFPLNADTRVFLKIGYSIPGTLDPGTEEDWFKAILVAGRSYTIINQVISVIDAELTIKGPSPSLTQIAYNDDGEGFGQRASSKIVLTPTTTGIYYLIASAYYDEVGQYKMAISEPGSCSAECTSICFLKKKRLNIIGCNTIPAPCATQCPSSKVCSACSGGKVAVGGACLSQCPDGSFNDDGVCTCKYSMIYLFINL